MMMYATAATSSPCATRPVTPGKRSSPSPKPSEAPITSAIARPYAPTGRTGEIVTTSLLLEMRALVELLPLLVADRRTGEGHHIDAPLACLKVGVALGVHHRGAKEVAQPAAEAVARHDNVRVGMLSQQPIHLPEQLALHRVRLHLRPLAGDHPLQLAQEAAVHADAVQRRAAADLPGLEVDVAVVQPLRQVLVPAEHDEDGLRAALVLRKRHRALRLVQEAPQLHAVAEVLVQLLQRQLHQRELRVARIANLRHHVVQHAAEALGVISVRREQLPQHVQAPDQQRLARRGANDGVRRQRRQSSLFNRTAAHRGHWTALGLQERRRAAQKRAEQQQREAHEHVALEGKRRQECTSSAREMRFERRVGKRCARRLRHRFRFKGSKWRNREKLVMEEGETHLQRQMESPRGGARAGCVGGVAVRHVDHGSFETSAAHATASEASDS
eukprot:scaffold1330_cov240-Pinguiococcus_pyrenoidosus.AAC.2